MWLTMIISARLLSCTILYDFGLIQADQQLGLILVHANFDLWQVPHVFVSCGLVNLHWDRCRGIKDLTMR